MVLVIFLFPDAVLPKMAEVSKSFENFLPGKHRTDIPQGMGAPEEIDEVFDSLYNTFINAREREDCFMNYLPLDVEDYTIELEYIEEEKGLYMRLLNEKQQLVSDHFANDIKPCIALPSKKKDVAKYAPIYKADIKKGNKLSFGGKTYHLFPDYPKLYAKGKEMACFFTDSKVIDPESKEVYGNNFLLNGFDNSNMETMTKDKDCVMAPKENSK
ncbi:hypothetical protein KY366_01220 [Candidatus Woesearchaeota archaeon]|nr:hypothetical protein [Candidatus Woesearchaeota archaeon]